jgi:hypothetical protein
MMPWHVHAQVTDNGGGSVAMVAVVAVFVTALVVLMNHHSTLFCKFYPTIAHPSSSQPGMVSSVKSTYRAVSRPLAVAKRKRL